MTDGTTGRVFNIQRYSLHDGSGIRTLVFLKGCPLRCLWCSNPESQKDEPELGLIMARCAGVEPCGAPCLPACPLDALHPDGQGGIEIDRDTCNICGRCAMACPEEALKVVGREMTVDEIMAEVEKDRPFYRRSGGGLTLGGGEPLAQYQFAAAILKTAAEEYIHTALETSGHAPWDEFEAVLKHVDLLQMDIKHMDSQRHQELTGQSNELILKNLGKVLSIKEPPDVIIRIPVIPGCNDSRENIAATAAHVAALGFTQIELIPYHKMGITKYSQYGMVRPLDGLEPPSGDLMGELRNIVESHGLREMTGVI